MSEGLVNRDAEKVATIYEREIDYLRGQLVLDRDAAALRERDLRAQLAEAEQERDEAKEKAAAYEGQYGELYEVVDALGFDHASTDSVPETIATLRADHAATVAELREENSKVVTENNAYRVAFGKKGKAVKWRPEEPNNDPFEFTINPMDNQGSQTCCRWANGTWLLAGFTETKVFREFQRIRADLAIEKSARLASEGQVAELRMALERVGRLTGGGCYDCMIAEGEVCERCREIRSTVAAALGSAAPGLSAVLTEIGTYKPDWDDERDSYAVQIDRATWRGWQQRIAERLGTTPPAYYEPLLRREP